MVRIIAICGHTGAGKSTVAKIVAAKTNGVIVPHDSYYADLPLNQDPLTYNFDTPKAIHMNKFKTMLEQVRNGAHSVHIPTYSHVLNKQTGTIEIDLQTKDTLIVEGIFVLCYGLDKLYDMSIYLDVSRDVCFQRRLVRDVNHRGRTEEAVRHQFKTFVDPSYELYVVPSKEKADVVLDWGFDNSQKLLNLV